MSMNSNNEKEICKIIPSGTKSGSSAASFCRILGIITWIGGLIIAIMSSQTAEISRYGYVEKSFNFSIFLSSAIIYGIAGGALYCVAELLENVQSIANSLACLSVFAIENNQQIKETIPSPKSSETEKTTKDRASSSETEMTRPSPNSNTSRTGKSLVETIIRSDVDWVDPSELGEFGQDLIAQGIYIKKELNAPEGLSESEAGEKGFVCWVLEDGKRRYFKNIKLVPNITKEELDAFTNKNTD